MSRSGGERVRLSGPIYNTVFNVALRRFDPERSHNFAVRSMRLATGAPGVSALIARASAPPPSLRTTALGREFVTPLTMAAGFDKNAVSWRALGLLGFGGVEVGTVTGLAQPGNPARPRITRLPRDRALINAMGFPNDGCEAVAARLTDRPAGSPVLGVNIGKSKSVEVADAVEDYRRSTRTLAPLADYLALNVSSPNTPGLRSMQSVEHLEPLVAGVREELATIGLAGSVPLLIKLAPDLSDAELREVAAFAVERELDGLIAVNTTIDMAAAANSGAELARQSHGGGISGAPLKARALEVLRLLHDAAGNRLTLVSVGGIETAADAWQRLLAGASLVQAYTAFVYGGPLWPRRFNRELAALLDASPFSSIGEAVGGGA